MDSDSDKYQVFGDCAAFFRALLPQALGFICHDRDGQPIWQALPADLTDLGSSYEAALAETLRRPLETGEGMRIDLPGMAAFIVRLAGDHQQPLATLTVLVAPPAAGLQYPEFIERIHPALRSLQREFSLRFRLLDSYRKLNVQAAEEKLLHEVETIVHQQQHCGEAFAHILALCGKYLQVQGLMLVIPRRGVRLLHGTTIREQEADRLSEHLIAPAIETPDAVAAEDQIRLPIQPTGQEALGTFVMRGWQHSGFSPRRRLRVARYIVSHIESLLNRDYDALTGLMAWPVFEKALVAACAEPERHTVVCFNIDQMHVVNDTFGREAGDEILTSFANLLREMFPYHLVTRIGGDNFATLLRDIDAGTVRMLCQTLCTRLHQIVYVRIDQMHRPSVSIGIGPLAVESDTGGGALATAQTACRAAKERGRNRIEAYEDADASIIRRVDDIQIVGHVRNAIENDRLVLMAQPIKALKPGHTAHYHEVLVRMLGDGGGHVPPAEFMKAAERYQLMEELDRWVVTNTLQLITANLDTLRRGNARFAINLSGQSLGNRGFLPFVLKQFSLTDVPPEMITFEITESVAMARIQEAQAFMRKLKKIGCKFSLDDFGTGLSSFAYLKLFPVDTLKIDGSFVRDMATNVVSQSVVAAIAEVSRVMGLSTVAEYVQDEVARGLLRDLGITYAQGYLVGEPEPLVNMLNNTTRATGLPSAPATTAYRDLCARHAAGTTNDAARR